MEKKLNKIIKLYNNIDAELDKNYSKFYKELKKSKKHYLKNKEKFKEIRDRINSYNYIIYKYCDHRKFFQPVFRDVVEHKKYRIENCISSFNKELDKIDNLFIITFSHNYLLYRGVSIEKSKFDELKIGSRGKFNTYLWVSKNPFYSSRFAGIEHPTFQSNNLKKDFSFIFYRITVPKGFHFITIDYDTYYPEKSNYEVIVLPRGCEYKVNNIEKKSMGKTEIYFVDIDLFESEKIKIYTLYDFDKFTYELL